MPGALDARLIKFIVDAQSNRWTTATYAGHPERALDAQSTGCPEHWTLGATAGHPEVVLDTRRECRTPGALNARSTRWTPGECTGYPESVLDERSDLWTLGELDARSAERPKRPLDARSQYWTPGESAGRPESVLDTWTEPQILGVSAIHKVDKASIRRLSISPPKTKQQNRLPNVTIQLLRCQLSKVLYFLTARIMAPKKRVAVNSPAPPTITTKGKRVRNASKAVSCDTP
jgi:hypothetical protein